MTQADYILFLQIVYSGRYRFDTVKGTIETFKVTRGTHVELHGNILSNGYRQVHLFLGRGKGPGLRIYTHQAIWMCAYGAIHQGLKVRHMDGDTFNNALSNLILTPTLNPDNAPEQTNKIRHAQVVCIKEILKSQPNRSAASIARELNVKYSTLFTCIARLKDGQKLKYEDPGPYPSPRNLAVKFMNQQKTIQS